MGKGKSGDYFRRPLGPKYNKFQGKYHGEKNKRDKFPFNTDRYPKHIHNIISNGNVPYTNPERQKKKEEKRKEQENKEKSQKQQGKLEKTIENEQEKK